ncbi:MAG: extracellular solute-binding protein [Armatimonadetes bacterium]|nr:extracellular solute-binding protein [Armatimonadota bacterium]
MELRHIWMGLGVAALVACVAATEKISEPTLKPGRVKVIYWESWTDFEAEAMQRVVDSFNRRQDKIFVEFVSTSGTEEKALMATAGGIPPDLAGLAGSSVPLYAYFQALTQLDDMCRDAGIVRDNYIPICFDLMTYKGHVYAMPTTPATTGYHYNRKILKEAGWNPDEPPRTIEELDAMDQMVMRKDKDGRVKRAGFLPAEPGWWSWSWPYFFGGRLIDANGKISTDLPANVRAYTWMQGYAKRYGVSQIQTFRQGFGQFNSPRNAFIDGTVASVIQGVWMANFIQKYNPSMDWAAAPFPYPADRPDLAGSVEIEQDCIVIPKGAKHVREAFEFLKYLQSQEGMEMLCLGQKKFSPLKQVSPEFYAKHANPFIRFFREEALSPNAFSTPRTPIWKQYGRELDVAIDKINLVTTDSPQQLLAKVRERVQPMQDEVDKIEKLRGDSAP